VVLYVLFVGLLNVCLGFVVASYLGQRYRDVARRELLAAVSRGEYGVETAGPGAPARSDGESPPADGSETPTAEDESPGPETDCPSDPFAFDTVEGLLGGAQDLRVLSDPPAPPGGDLG